MATETAAPEGCHPQRYPVHSDPRKGQAFGGECNRTACHNDNAVFWNMGTYGLYCPGCAAAINSHAAPPLCIRVEAKPAVADMEQFKRDNGYYGWTKTAGGSP